MAKKPAAKAKKRGRPSKSAAMGSLQVSPPETVTISPPPASADVSLAVKAGAAPKAQTIVYVHGIGNLVKMLANS